MPGVTEGVLKILGAIPGLDVVDLAQPRVGYMCNSLAPVAAFKRALHARELAAAEAAGVQVLQVPPHRAGRRAAERVDLVDTLHDCRLGQRFGAFAEHANDQVTHDAIAILALERN